jgi:integrase
MAKRTLTDRVIRALKPAAPGKRNEVSDGLVPGLWVRVTDKGSKSFAVVARYPGTGSKNPTRRTLGAYGELTLEEARTKARAWLALVARGIDPAEQDESERLARERKRANSFAAVAEDFIANKVRSERRGAEVERTIRNLFIPIWGNRAITDVEPLDVLAVIRPIAARAPYFARNVLGYVDRLFDWAIEQHAYGIKSSPCDRLKPSKIIGETKPRSRVLTDDELYAFWRATARLSYPAGPLLRLLLLTGQRHGEVAGAPWSEFDFAKEIWTIDPTRFKSNAIHQVPLTANVLTILKNLPRLRSSEFVFPARSGKGMAEIHYKVKARLDARMLRTLRAMARVRREDPSRVRLQSWVVHDLRRTLRSHLSALRIPDHIAEMVIGHGRQGLQRVYDQHRYESEKREALEAWAKRLRDIVEPPPANVVSLEKARG